MEDQVHSVVLMDPIVKIVVFHKIKSLKSLNTLMSQLMTWENTSHQRLKMPRRSVKLFQENVSKFAKSTADSSKNIKALSKTPHPNEKLKWSSHMKKENFYQTHQKLNIKLKAAFINQDWHSITLYLYYIIFMYINFYSQINILYYFS